MFDKHTDYRQTSFHTTVQSVDNGPQLAQLRRNLRHARLQALTPRQQQLVHLYFDQKLTMPEIAELLSINCSTVSRTIHRAQVRLHQRLQYGIYT